MELLCECSCRLNRGHKPVTHAVGETDVIFQALKRRESLQAPGRQHDPSRIFQTAPAGTVPQSRVRAGRLCKGPVGHTVGVDPGGSPAASAARSTVSRPPNSQPQSPSVPIGHTRAGIARVTSQQHLSGHLVLLCCSDFPVDFSVGNSFPTLIQADFSFCHRRPLAFS